MRKGIAGLSALAQDQLRQKPAGGAVFVFRGRRGDRVKVLYWDFEPLERRRRRCLHRWRIRRQL